MKPASGSSRLLQSLASNLPQLGQTGFLLNVRLSFLPICVLFLLIISAGCARPPAPVERPPSVPFETGKLKERSDFWSDYQCKFRLMVDSKTSKFSSRAIILVKGRDFVRFETFTPFGQTAALYVSNEAGPGLLIPSEKVIFTAQRPETLVREFLGVTLPVDIFRYALTASVPPRQLDHIESRPDDGAWRLISSGEGGYFEWQITAGSPALKGAFVRSAEFEGRVSYDPPVPISKEAVPGKIRISSNEWKMEIIIEELRPVSQFEPSAFHLPNLPNVRKVDLDTIK
ncbi:MAG: lipoprotein insertase outer membrane protein LolB [Syntrophobacteraceae bacterium]